MPETQLDKFFSILDTVDEPFVSEVKISEEGSDVTASYIPTGDSLLLEVAVFSYMPQNPSVVMDVDDVANWMEKFVPGLKFMLEDDSVGGTVYGKVPKNLADTAVEILREHPYVSTVKVFIK